MVVAAESGAAVVSHEISELVLVELSGSDWQETWPLGSMTG
jgi:hypothetical protein